MKQNVVNLLLPVFFLIVSCTEPYQFPEIERQTTIVITGMITNEAGPYFVRVEENVSNLSTLITAQRAINDARVTITDSNGNVDELHSFLSVALDSALIVWDPKPEWWWEGMPDSYEYFYNIPDEQGGYVKFIVDNYGWISYDIRDGAYFTTTTKGIPGHSYTLKVEYAGREYTATDYMCHGTVIDSISEEPLGKYVNGKPDGSDGFMVPCLYFAEPQDEVNFYMFTMCATTSNRTYIGEGKFKTETSAKPAKELTLRQWIVEDWGFSVISDRFLPPYVNQYKMSDGDHARKWFQGTDMGFYGGWGSGIAMYCITEPVYRYYAALSKQYYDDGGAFAPSPASPPTNFRGGAQGCFSAASVSQYISEPVFIQ